MQVDTELVAAGVYLAAGPVYVLVWRHSKRWYAVLAGLALILGFCAFLRSETMRAGEPPVRPIPVVPVGEPGRGPGLLALGTPDAAISAASQRDGLKTGAFGTI